MRVLAAEVQILRKANFAAAGQLFLALTLATLFNAGIFSHGGVLVGSLRLGALLNSLGVRLPANYRTEDIDLGSTGSISVAIPEERSFSTFFVMIVFRFSRCGTGLRESRPRRSGRVDSPSRWTCSCRYRGLRDEGLAALARPRDRASLLQVSGIEPYARLYPRQGTRCAGDAARPRQIRASQAYESARFATVACAEGG